MNILSLGKTYKYIPKNEEITIKEENKEIKIKFSYNENDISIIVENLKSFPKNIFELFKSLGELQRINKYFKYFETTEELINALIKSITSKDIKILIEDKICNFEINNPIINAKFRINIPIKQKNIKDELETIIPIVKELKIRVEKLEKENEELKKKFKQFEPKITQNSILDNIFENSKIITTKEEKELILRYLPKKLINTTLIYDSEIYGDTARAFHSCCDGKNPTLYIIKSKKGYKFGGYISQPWNGKNCYNNDNEAFYFSLNLKKKYFLNNPTEAFYGNPDCGPIMRGGISLNIYNLCKNSSENFVVIEDNQGEKYEINGGEQYFKVESYEVYLINY